MDQTTPVSGLTVDDIVSLSERITLQRPLAVSVYDPPDRQKTVRVRSARIDDNADAAYVAFFERYIKDRPINLYGTSLYDTYGIYPSPGLVQSGYRADHYCLNLLLPAVSDQPQSVMQLLYEAKDAFLPPIGHADATCLKEHLYGQIYQKGVVDRQDASVITADAAGSVAREALILHWDISSYRRILSECGESTAEAFCRNVQEMMAQPATHFHAGDILRSEGDGAWMAFPCTGFSSQQKTALLEGCYHLTQEMIGNYRGLCEWHAASAIRQSHLKIALTGGEITVQEQKSRYSPANIDSIGFVRGRSLMKHMPRGQDVVVIDEGLSGFTGSIPREKYRLG